VRNDRVADIDVCHIGAAGAIRGNVDLTRAERKPSDTQTPANAEVIAVSRTAADEHHQSRRVHRANSHRSGHPAPYAPEQRPPAVVERRKSPGGVVNPGPAPWLDPDPVAEPVRSPSDDHRPREPYGPVIGISTPVSILVKIIHSDDVSGNVLERCDLLGASIAGCAETIEAVCGRGRSDFVRHLRSAFTARDSGLLARAYCECLSGRSYFRLARSRDHSRCGSVRLHLKPVFASAQQRYRGLRRVNLKIVLFVQSPKMDLCGAFGDLDLNCAVVQVQESQVGAVVQSNERVS